LIKGGKEAAGAEQPNKIRALSRHLSTGIKGRTKNTGSPKSASKPMGGGGGGGQGHRKRKRIKELQKPDPARSRGRKNRGKQLSTHR